MFLRPLMWLICVKTSLLLSPVVFFLSQTRRKFQYFAIQDSSIIMGLLEESLKAKGGPRSSNATILVTEWKAPGIFLTKKNNRQRDQFFQFLFVKSYCKFHLCPSPSSSSSSVSRCQPCFYPWTVNRNAFVIRYFFTVLRHVFLCLSLLRFPSGTQPFFSHFVLLIPL